MGEGLKKHQMKKLTFEILLWILFDSNFCCGESQRISKYFQTLSHYSKESSRIFKNLQESRFQK